jgi:phage terminase large subunit-like protein
MSERDPPARKPRASPGRGWRDGGGGPPLLRSIGALLKLSPAERAKLLGAFSEKQCAEVYYDWSLWARDDQRPPPGDWIYWLILAGRGAGKTRAGAEAVRQWAKSFAIVNLIGATHDDVRDVMVLGESGLMAICPRDERPRYARAAGRLAWPNGATSLLFSAEEPDRLRALPTRADLHSLDEHIAERLDALAARLDRMLDV